jgi:UDP-glucose 4-epimerase
VRGFDKIPGVKLLVTGAAGYVGSVVAALLLGRGHDVTVLDNLSRGHRAAIPSGAEFLDVDLRDATAVKQATDDGFDGALHFAALALVGESVEHPERYWHTNVGGTRNLLDGLTSANVPRLVFSSTCATYGTPDKVPMDEQTPTRPESPYGRSKLAVDMMIGDECAAHGLNATSLRYFNVAGASGGLGEDHHPETHLIPNVLRAAMGELERVEIFGTDYPTPDGTAIRDYIHVADLAEAHALALEGGREGEHRIFNLGSGHGYSVREVIDQAREVTEVDIPVREGPRRAGDPTALVASSDLIREALGWEPRKDLFAMLEDAWTWHQAHPNGYDDLEGGASPS